MDPWRQGPQPSLTGKRKMINLGHLYIPKQPIGKYNQRLKWLIQIHFLNGPRDHIPQTLDLNPHEMLFWHPFLTNDFVLNKLNAT